MKVLGPLMKSLQSVEFTSLPPYQTRQSLSPHLLKNMYDCTFAFLGGQRP